MNWELFILQKTEALKDIKGHIQGAGHWAKCLILSLGSRECHCPLGLEGAEWGEDVGGENNAKKEAGKWHNGQGKKEGQRELVTLWTPTLISQWRRRPQGRRGDHWNAGDPGAIFAKGYSVAKIKFKGEARKYSRRKDIVKLWLSPGRRLWEHCHDSDWNKKAWCKLWEGMVSYAVILEVKHANNEASRSGVCCLQAKWQKRPNLVWDSMSPFSTFPHLGGQPPLSRAPNHSGSSRFNIVRV